MIVELLTLFALWLIVSRLVRPFRPQNRRLVWTTVLLWVVGMAIGHHFVLAKDPRGIIPDLNVDAVTYYETAAELVSLQADSPEYISDASGSAVHLGYFYANLFAMKLSQDPMLLLRLGKLTLFMAALLLVTRLWRTRYGERLAMLGFLFLALGHWEMFYYNFRNLKDGVIASLVLLLFYLIENMILAEKARAIPAATQRFTRGWVLIGGILAILFTFRVYYVAAIMAGIGVAIILQPRIRIRSRVIGVAGVVAGTVLLACFPEIRGSLENLEVLEKVETLNFDTVLRVVKTLASPIPWQYHLKFLIPSHCLYLPVMCFGIFSCLLLIRRKPWWQITVVASVVLFIAVVFDPEDGAEARRRLPLVVFLVSWVLAGLHACRRPIPRCTSDVLARRPQLSMKSRCSRTTHEPAMTTSPPLRSPIPPRRSW